jgi:hypothetical protein
VGKWHLEKYRGFPKNKKCISTAENFKKLMLALIVGIVTVFYSKEFQVQ